ncbi:MAG: hypothetical protein H7249_09660 [Chitinophagaceae bacterium]|nr:hypothetical protein [Oligoflexus sp.]
MKISSEQRQPKDCSNSGSILTLTSKSGPRIGSSVLNWVFVDARVCLIGLFTLLLSCSLLRADTIPMPLNDLPLITLNHPGSIDLGIDFTYYEDLSASLTPGQLLAQPQLFKKAELSDLNQVHTNANFWLRTRIANFSDFDTWYLTAVYPLVEFQAYRVDHALGEQAPQPMRIPAARLDLKRGETGEFLVRVSSQHILNLQFQLDDQAGLYTKDREEGMFFALLCGCFLAMIIYNCFLYMSLRDPNYLYYILFVIVNIHLNLLAIKFPDTIFLWGGINWWKLVNIYSPFAPLTMFLFVRSFLQTRTLYPRLDKVFLGYIGGLLILAFGQIWAIDILFEVADFYFLVGIFILVFAGVISFKDGFKPSLYYLLGLAALFIGIVIYLGRSQGLFPTNLITINAHMVGQAAEMLLMSLALGAKIKMLERENVRTLIMAQVKGRLLRVISHDIANPLSVVKATAYSLLSREVIGERMPMILRAVAMIEDIMQFVIKSEAIDGNEGSIPLEPVSIGELFESLAFLFNDKAAEKGIRLVFLQEAEDLFVLAEHTSLRSEVMSNLISNAIKFSFPGGAVRVTTETLTGPGGERIKIIVNDQGMGMSANHLVHLFDPVENSSRTGTKGERGTGYGMPLAKACLDVYKATIDVQSVTMDQSPTHSGTCFTTEFQRAYSKADV